MRSALDTLEALVPQLRVDGRRRLRLGARGPWVEAEAAEDALGQWLYERLFVHWHGDADLDVGGAPWFVAQLLGRARDATYLEPGFKLIQREALGAFVQSDAIRLWVTEANGFAPRTARVGKAVAVRLPCAREAAVPGFFTLVSRLGRPAAGAPHIKAYLNVTPKGALGLVEALVQDRFIQGVRCEAKVVNDPLGFGRRDTAVLFVQPSGWKRMAWWLRALEQYEAGWFRDGAPHLTLPVARGISAAESPPSDDDSYGGHRCRLVARGVLSALVSKGDWQREVTRAFESEGLDFERPWLGRLSDGWTRV